MARRMRLIGWNVQPVVMADDGENLAPVQVNGTQVLAADWQAFKDGGDAEALEGVRAQVEATADDGAPAGPAPPAGDVPDQQA
jgi:hypothetical protein